MRKISPELTEEIEPQKLIVLGLPQEFNPYINVIINKVFPASTKLIYLTILRQLDIGIISL